MSGFIAVGYFLISLVFDLFLFSLWTRVALRYLRISSLNQFSRLIYTLTNPIVAPVHLILRYKDQAKHRFDWPVLGLIVLVELVKIILLSLLAFNKLMPILLIVLYVGADLIIQPCNFLFYALLIRVIMSYATPIGNIPSLTF